MTVQNVGINIAWTGKGTRREAFLTNEDGDMAKIAALSFHVWDDYPSDPDSPLFEGWLVEAYTGDRWRVKTVGQAENGLRGIIEDIVAAEAAKIDAAIANLEAVGLQPEVVS